MKIMARTLIILLAATVVAGVFYLIVSNISLPAEAGMEGRQFPEGGGGELYGKQLPGITSGDGQVFQPEKGMGGRGDHQAASLSQGFAEIGMVLAKIAGITLIVLLIQKGIDLANRKQLAGSTIQG